LIQTEWRHEVIEIAIDVLSGSTYKERDIACKQLLKYLKNMPEIQDYDIDEQLPF
jgi:hypothetical protein